MQIYTYFRVAAAAAAAAAGHCCSFNHSNVISCVSSTSQIHKLLLNEG